MNDSFNDLILDKSAIEQPLDGDMPIATDSVLDFETFCLADEN